MQSSYDKIRFYRLDSVKKEKIIRKLEGALANEERIKLALVFGSLTSRHSVRDIDVCIYSAPILDFKEFLGLNARIELDIGIPIDISELSNLSPSLRINVLRHGVLVKGPRNLHHRLLDQAYSELTAIKQPQAKRLPTPQTTPKSSRVRP